MRIACVSLLCLAAAVSFADAEIYRLTADLIKNARAHHTEKYKLSMQTLIVRRGGDIELSVEGRGEMSTIYAEVKLDGDVIDHFDLKGDRPGTPDKKNQWSSKIDKIDTNMGANTYTIFFTLSVPVNSPVGHFDISLFEEGNEGRTLVQQLYILFNPWNKEDGTFMISQSERNEYVLNDVGQVYTGWSGRDWIYGQFHENALPAVMMIMKSIPDLQTNKSILSDPVRLSRALSAGVNANDGFGVLVGNWGGNYYPYTSPTSWASSIDILEKYYLSGGTSVRYGQCWVFAAVLNAVLRTLGIPARPVTTLGSAHDTDNSLTIDHFYDENMNEIDGYGSDSIWNFHSWTEAWIARPEITTRAAGGWQVVDATPQETSDGIFQTGPASVTGVKKGDIDNYFDMHFVFSEVQSVDTRWKVDPSEPMGWKRLSVDNDAVGSNVYTKAVGSNEKVDITKNYKFVDLKERRLALMNAAKRAGVELLIHDVVVTKGVEFTLSPFKLTMIGETLTGFVEMVNTLNTTVNVNTKIRIDSMFYNDVKINRIATVGKIVELAPDAREMVSFEIPFEDYYTKLLDNCLVSISASAIVTETDQIWVRDADIALKSPPVTINLVGEAREWISNEFRVTFTNPLPIPLTECHLLVHGTRQYMKLGLNNIASGETVEYEVDISIDHIPLVFADINCAEVTGMTGSTTITFV